MALPISIEQLLGSGVVESSRIEYKEGWNPDAIYRTICAFANDFDNIGGGYVIVGVEERNGRAVRPVKGLDIEKIEPIEKDMIGFNNLIRPFYCPKTSIEDIDGKKVFVNGIAVVSGLRGSFSSVDGLFDPKKHKLAVTSYTYGDFQDCLKGTVPENTVKGGTPSLSRINEAGQDDEVIVGEEELTITGRDLAPEASAADEGVFLASVKTGERIASAEVLSSNLVEVVCRFSELPPPGRHRLVVATRCGMGGAYKVVEAGREVEVKEAAE